MIPSSAMTAHHFPQLHATLVGIDSDGCVFDSMRVKQCIHFHPLIICFWGLERFEAAFRACAEFVNLKSVGRGSNRFVALMRSFELLKTYPGIDFSGYAFPDFTALKAYIDSGVPLGNPTLKQALEKSRDPELARVYAWSLAINQEIDTKMQPVPPFPWARKALELMQASSDTVVISQTPEEALFKEWTLHNIRPFAAWIAGLEFGSKTEQIRVASAGRYAPDRILMLGDALGDHAAARDNGASFYPILPEDEERSWERFCTEAYPRFLAGTYAGVYEQTLVDAFYACLPATPPWQ